MAVLNQNFSGRSCTPWRNKISRSWQMIGAQVDTHRDFSFRFRFLQRCQQFLQLVLTLQRQLYRVVIQALKIRVILQYVVHFLIVVIPIKDNYTISFLSSLTITMLLSFFKLSSNFMSSLLNKKSGRL